MTSLVSRVSGFVDEHIYLVSIVLRVLIVAYSVLHDRLFRVKYTDIDYMIIVDGARFILEGRCPFARTTYRYTPLLALLVLPSAALFDAFGKLLFSACDVVVMYLCDRLLSPKATRSSKLMMLKLFIALNPIVVNVSTRGNSDMLITLFTLVALYCFEKQQYVMAAGTLGFAVHFKIYPLIYVPPFAIGVLSHLQRRRRQRLQAAVTLRPPKHTLQDRPEYLTFLLWLRVVIASAVAFLFMFTVPTALCYIFCGKEYIDEAFLYHIVREDHRHNFSPYWLLMYLNMAGRAQGYGAEYAPGLLAFVPQVVVLLFISWMLRRNVAQACCVVTVLFVAFNKVCTVQYFVWFVPLLPFVFHDPSPAAARSESANVAKCPVTDCTASAGAGVQPPPAMAHHARINSYRPPSHGAMLLAVTGWCATIPIWVSTTFPLEFLGENHLGRVWLASCLFFLATAALGGWLGRVSYFSQLMLSASSAAIPAAPIHMTKTTVSKMVKQQ